MTAHSFSPAVEIQTGLGQYRMVHTAEDAARQLLTQWPTERGDAYVRAHQACLDVLEGKAPPNKARRAFIAACQEADVFVRN